MKIAHIGPSGLSVDSTHGGAVQRRMVRLAEAQVRAGHEVTLLSPEGSDGVRNQGRIRTVAVGLRSERPFRDYEFGLKARRILADGDFDVLHGHAFPEAARLLKGVASKTVQTVDFFRYRLTRYALGREYYLESLNSHNAIMPVSHFCGSQMLAYYRRISSPVEVVFNGVDLTQFSAEVGHDDESIRLSLLSEPGSPYVLYLGRLCTQKGSDLLGPLSRVLAAQGVRVVAAGPAEQFGNRNGGVLTSELERSGVDWLGAVHETAVAPLLRGASIAVLPTREDEMFGMAALEALACGTPVVASALGGIPEAVGPAAVLFEPGDQESFNSSVTELLANEKHQAELVEAARPHVQSFSWSKIATATELVYRGT